MEKHKTKISEEIKSVVSFIPSLSWVVGMALKVVQVCSTNLNNVVTNVNSRHFACLRKKKLYVIEVDFWAPTSGSWI